MAITYQSSVGGGGGFTDTATVAIDAGTGSNRLMAAGASSVDSSNQISSLQFNSVSLTRINGNAIDPPSVELFYLIAPDTGSHNLVGVWNAANPDPFLQAVVLNGAAQTGQPETSGSAAINASSITVSLTTSTDGAWGVAFFAGHAGSTVISGSTGRESDTGLLYGDVGLATQDFSTAGSGKSMGWETGAGNRALSVAAFAAAATATTSTSTTSTSSSTSTTSTSKSTSTSTTSTSSSTSTTSTSRSTSTSTTSTSSSTSTTSTSTSTSTTSTSTSRSTSTSTTSTSSSTSTTSTSSSTTNSMTTSTSTTSTSSSTSISTSTSTTSTSSSTSTSTTSTSRSTSSSTSTTSTSTSTSTSTTSTSKSTSTSTSTTSTSTSSSTSVTNSITTSTSTTSTSTTSTSRSTSSSTTMTIPYGFIVSKTRQQQLREENEVLTFSIDKLEQTH